MCRMSKNVFLHFLNKDTQQIFGLENQNETRVQQDLKKCVNASILLCDDDKYCIMPIGFWFESNLSRKLLLDYPESIEAGFIRFSMREEDLVEYIEKKREQYSSFLGSEMQKEAYEKFYKEDVFLQFSELNPRLIDRKTKIGRTCAEIWLQKHNDLINKNAGDLLQAYININDPAERRKIGKAVSKVVWDPEIPFVWGTVNNIIKELEVRDPTFKKELRIQFEKEYYLTYLHEYEAVNLYNSYIDKGIDFDINFPKDSIANYKWLEMYLEHLGLEKLLAIEDKKLVYIKKTMYWRILFSQYITLCNKKSVTSNNSFGLQLIKMETNDDLEEAKSKIKEIILNNEIINPDIFISHRIPRFADVLIMVATNEEENAIRNCEEWESKKTKDGYEFFITRNGQMTFALANTFGKGGVKAASATQLYRDFINPRFIAMAGFCAGQKNNVNLGDVFVPEKIYEYDTGKQISETDLLPEINSYTLDPLWELKINRFGKEWRDSIEIERPISYERQVKTFIETMKENNYKMGIIELRNNPNLPNITSIIEDECSSGHLNMNMGSVITTEEGIDYYENEYAMKYYQFFEPELSIKTGALATGNRVQQWDGIFEKLEKQYDKNTYALDMEGYAVADVARIVHVPFIIAKGVGDFASGSKAFDNRYIEYSTVASFKFIMAFFNSLKGLELLGK